MKNKDILTLRKEWYNQQKGIDPVLKKHVDFEETVLDHNHKTKFCRGVLQRYVNSFEGRVNGIYKRSGLMNEIPLPELLRNLAEYLETNHEGEQIIHPKEVKRKVLAKNSYNKLKKVELKLPKYTGRLTKALERLFIKHNIEIEYLK
jgi:hypothetical protein